MLVRKVLLKNYRNFTNLSLELSHGINIFYGNNAQGKTNFLESIYLASKGRVQRSHLDRELILFGKEEANVQLIIEKNNYIEKIEIHLKKDNKKGIAINGIPIKKLGDLYGILLTVNFSPEDLNLIKSGPMERRKFLDIELCQLNKIYYYELKQYYKILKQRNCLLKSLKYDNNNIESLFIWDEQLVYHGCKIIEFRKHFIDRINIIANKIHNEITQKNENLKVTYKPNTAENDFKNKLYKNIDKDLLFGITSVGIHKDDINFYLNDIDVKKYGSQGQQRTAALSAKLAEIQIIKEEKNSTPILLLDDVLSELDESRQRYLLNSIKHIQTIITCTGIEDLIKKVSSEVNIYKVEDGLITFEKFNFMI